MPGTARDARGPEVHTAWRGSTPSRAQRARLPAGAGRAGRRSGPRRPLAAAGRRGRRPPPGAALAVPVGLYGGPVGACLVVSAIPRTWSEGAAAAYASVLAALLQLAAEAQRSAGLSARVRDLLDGQAVVEQAKGALMARRGIDAEAAAEQLEQLARRSGRPLEDVAAGLLRRLGAGGGR